MTENTLMPDFADALERRLREIATATGQGPRSRASLRPRRLVIAGLACGALAAAIVALAAGDRDGVETAYGKPLILATAPVDAAKVLGEIQDGLTVRLALGADATLTAARPIPAFGGTAYVLTGDAGWCLTAPDPAMPSPATADPARSGAVTCAKRADVYRYGIALGVGNNVIAAIPDGAREPTVTSPDGSTRALEPTSQGVVSAVELPARSSLTLYASDGSTRTLRLP
jgi:hypothetical protein